MDDFLQQIIARQRDPSSHWPKGPTSMQTRLGDVLRQAGELPWSHALFAHPGAEALAEETPVLVWDVDDIDEADTDLPAAAIALGYEYVLGMQDVQSIVAGARQQRPEATIADLLAAFYHYLDHDAFIVWNENTA